MPRSLKAQLIVASVLWTAGLLFLMHLGSFVLHQRVPMPRGRAAAAMVTVAVAMMASGLLMGQMGAKPLEGLRGQVEAVKNGKAKRIYGRFPAEVEPLVESLNELIADRERSVERARAAAGDLAHSLKTPLAILAREADAARAAGNAGLAEVLEEQIGRMSGRIDYQLARARAAAMGGAARAEVKTCGEALARTLKKLYAERGLEMELEGEAWVRMRAEDVEEVLGNLMDNACKWARGRVRVRTERRGEWVEVAVEDDGPGMAEEARARVLERGVRLDETAPGAGLGLSIVRELVEQHGGAVRVESCEWGGAKVSVTLPGAGRAA